MNKAQTIAACLILAMGALVWMYRRLATAGDVSGVSQEWWKSFSPARYAPLNRLLRTEDARFLRSLAGYEPALERRLRRQRIAAFRGYLDEMNADYNRLQAIGRALVVSGQAKPTLTDELIRQRWAFRKRMLAVEMELAAYRCGLGRVDVASLLESFQVTVALLPASPETAAA